jgi:hypothetical protein
MNALSRLLLLPIVFGLSASPVVAQATLTWNGSASTAWGNAANWTPNAVPGPLDTAIIPGELPNTPIVTGTVSIAGLDVQSAAHLRVLGTPAAHALLTVASGFTNRGTIELGNDGSTQRGDLTVTAGALINEGLILSRTGSATTDPNRLDAELENRTLLRVERNLTINKPGAQHRNGGGIELLSADLTFVQTGEGATIHHTGSIQLSAGRTLTVNGGTFRHDGSVLMSGTGKGSVVYAGVVVHLVRNLQPDRLDVSASNTTIHGPGSFLNEEGHTLTLTNSTINADLDNRGTVRVFATSAIAGAFTNAGALRVLGTPAAHALLTVAAGFTNTGEVELGNDGSTQRGSLTVTAGALVNHGLIVSRSGAATADPNALDAELDNRGALRVERSLAVNKPGAVHRNSGSIEIQGGDLTITQAGELAAVIQTGDIEIRAGRTLTVSGATVYIQNGSIRTTEPTVLAQVGTLNMVNTTLNLTPDFDNVDLALVFSGTVVHGPGKLTNQPGRFITLTNSTINADLDNRGTVQAFAASAIAGAFTNAGALRVLGTPAAHALLTVAAGFTNTGEVELGNDGSTQRGSLTVTAGALVNHGLIVSRSGAATADPNALDAELDNRGALRVERSLAVNKPGARHTNAGRVDVAGGNMTVNLSSAAEFENAGRATVHPGRTLTFTSGSLTNTPAGVFHGGGTLSVAGTSFNNSGTFAPGLRPMFGENLIANGDAERGPVGSSADNVTISGWSDSGPMTVLPYDFEDSSQAYLASSDPGPEDRGTRYLWGGVGPSSTITQTVNLADIAYLVDRGIVTYQLSGWLGGFSVQNDQMRLTASFRDASNEELAGAALGPVTAVDRNFQTGLLLREAEGAIPAGTRSVLLTLTATRFAGTANNGFADNLSLVLQQQGGAEQGRTTGILSVQGDLPMLPDEPRVEIALGGLTAGEQYDRVAVSGTTTLDGTLYVSVVNNFIPSDGDEFIVMTFASREGEFSEVAVSGLPEGVTLTPEYTPTHVLLRASGEATSPPPPALTVPANGARDVSTTPTLRWQPAVGAVSYQLQLATDATFSSPIADETTTGTNAEAGPLNPSTTHYWRVRATNGTEYSPWSHVYSFTTAAPVSGEDGTTAPLAYALEPNYPNPFSGRTTIRFMLAEDQPVRLEVFDLLGRRVAVVVDGPIPRGVHDLQWNAEALPSGPYVYRLSAGDFVAIRQMLLVRP